MTEEDKIREGEKEMSPQDKLRIFSNMPEVVQSVKLLKAIYDDMDCQAFIRLTWDFGDKEFELIFQETKSMDFK